MWRFVRTGCALAVALAAAPGCDLTDDGGIDFAADPADFTLREVKADGTEGGQISLRQFRGKTVVIDFYFNGCTPCKFAIPALHRIAQSHAQRNDIVFLLVNVFDPVDQIRGTVDQPLATGPKYQQSANMHVLHGGGDVMLQYNPDGSVPFAMIIDKTGTVVETKTGLYMDVDKNVELLTKFLKPHISE